ncbi:cytochrome c biogenesis CcdA family protein [Micromonospora sp. CPCC 206061]|uniref:cytochrome c biogenesis CcdA family protein n=1 Tax=Micromonospora sp. CPCC 206061 TaxID=3122410 RepID=UPI002FF2FB31
MFDAPYALALVAGLLAAVNPCGFALLPAYLSFLILDDSTAEGGRGRAAGRALTLTAAMTAGFVAVFGGFGLLAAPAADLVARHLPWVSIAIGLVLLAAGGWLLAGRQLPALGVKIGTGPEVSRRFGAITLFGASYAIASLGCTIGPFLAVVVAGFRTDSVFAGVGLFLAYAAGMTLVIGTVAMAVALARTSLILRIRRAAPFINRAAGGLLLVAGGYVAWYGWYELRVFRDGDTTDPIIDTATRAQATIARWLDQAGPAVAAATFAALLLATVAAQLLRRTRR